VRKSLRKKLVIVTGMMMGLVWWVIMFLLSVLESGLKGSSSVLRQKVCVYARWVSVTLWGGECIPPELGMK